MDTGKTYRSAHLLAEEYKIIEGVTLPVGISNKDLQIEDLEPENAEKLTIDGARGAGKLKMAESPDQGLGNEGFLKYLLDLINIER